MYPMKRRQGDQWKSSILGQGSGRCHREKGKVRELKL